MNKKFIGLILAAIVFTSAGSFGTYAYFTSTYDLSEKVEIEMGSINVIAEWLNKKWTIEENNKEAKQDDNKEGLSVSNVKKGTVATRKITITNKGTLSANVDVILKNSIDGLEITFNDNNNNVYNVKNMNPGESVELTIKAKVTKKPGKKTENIFNGEIKDFVVVNAEQLK